MNSSRTLLLLLLLTASILIAAEPPYGAADFYPSPERPLGFLADGGSHYPGATFPKKVDVKTGDGVCWSNKVPMGMAQPLVIGEKIIITADPNLLICFDVHEGKEQWRLALPAHRDMPQPLAEGYQEELAYYEQALEAYAHWRALGLRLDARRHQAKLHHKKFPVQLRDARSKGDRAVPIPIDDERFQKDLKVFRKEQGANGWAFHVSNNSAMVTGRFRTWQDKVMRLYGYNTFNNWYGYLTRSFQTPVTDGTYVYFVGTQNQVACVDLFGRLRWLRWLPHDHTGDPRMHCRFVRSPVLFGNTLVARASGYIRAIDSQTGAVIWSVGFRPGLRPKPEATPMRILHLPDPSGTMTPILLDSGGLFFRLSDGAKLGKVPTPEIHWASRYAIYGDILVSPQEHALRGFRLSYDGKAITTERLWEHKGRETWGGLEYGDQVLAALRLNKRKETALVDPLTGTFKKLDRPKHIKSQYGFPIIIGDDFVDWFDPMQKGQWSKARISWNHLPSHKRGHWSFVDKRLKSDAEFRHRWAHRGSNFFCMSNSAPTAQGDRFYFRTTGLLTCFSDQAGKAPVASSWPAHGRLGTDAPTLSQPATILEGLSSDYADMRQQALADLAAGASVSADALVAAYRASSGAKRTDILRAMALKPEGLSAAAHDMAQDIMNADHGLSQTAAWTFTRLEDVPAEARAPLVAFIKQEQGRKYRKLPKGVVPPVQRLFAVILALIGSGAEEQLQEFEQRHKHDKDGGWIAVLARKVLAGTHAEAKDRPSITPLVANSKQ